MNADGSQLYVAGYKRLIRLDTKTGAVWAGGGEPKTQVSAWRPGTDEANLYVMILIDARIQALELATGKTVWTYPATEPAK